MKTWKAKIPKISKIKDRKKCYRLWTFRMDGLKEEN